MQLPRSVAGSLVVTLGVAASLGAGLAPRGASACYNAVEIELTPVQEIAQAESDLEHGRLGEAGSRIRGRYPGIRNLNASAPPLAQKALRVYSLVLARADGRLDSGYGWARWGNLEWAVETLADLDRAHPNEPRRQADLAEARTRLARSRSEGVRVLENLDQRDLLGSPFAYQALARGRRALGDDAGATAALRRCSMMSNDKSNCVTDFMGEMVDPRASAASAGNLARGVTGSSGSSVARRR